MIRARKVSWGPVHRGFVQLTSLGLFLKSPNSRILGEGPLRRPFTKQSILTAAETTLGPVAIYYKQTLAHKHSNRLNISTVSNTIVADINYHSFKLWLGIVWMCFTCQELFLKTYDHCVWEGGMFWHVRQDISSEPKTTHWPALLRNSQ